MFSRNLFYLSASIAFIQPAFSKAEDIVLSYYNKGKTIAKNSANLNTEFFNLLDDFLNKEKILERICPGYSTLNAGEKEKIKTVVIKKMIEQYATIFKKHCQNQQDLVIKGVKSTGGQQVRIKSQVRYPNTGQKIDLDLILEQEKLIDIIVNNGLSLLKSFEKKGAENWRKANANVDSFVALYQKNS